jgi:hypothetical protein
MALFRQIIHQLTVNKDALLALGALAAIASPFVVLVGVVASVLIANKNLKGTLITNQRRAWINEVRNEVAAILAALGPLQIDFPSQEQATRMVHLMNELLLTQAKLTLLMDPKNNAQRELLHVATNAIQHAHEAREAKAKARQARGPLEAPAKKPDQPDPLVSADIEKLINTTQKVISEAWKKARSLK